MACIYLERGSEEPQIFLNRSAHVRLLRLLEAAGSRIALEELSYDGKQSRYAATDEQAQAIACGIDAILPDVPTHDCVPDSPHRIDGGDFPFWVNPVQFWSGQKAWLERIRDYCLGGAFTILIDESTL